MAPCSSSSAICMLAASECMMPAPVFRTYFRACATDRHARYPLAIARKPEVRARGGLPAPKETPLQLRRSQHRLLSLRPV